MPESSIKAGIHAIQAPFLITEGGLFSAFSPVCRNRDHMSKASSNAIQRITHSLSPIMDMLYPPRCAGCQRTGHVLCSACLAQILPLPAPVCPRCGLPTVQAGLCRECLYAQQPLKHITALRAASEYREPLRACIRALKYDGSTRLAEPLGLLLAGAYRSYGLSADALLPVPLHRGRFAQRGYNHAALLAQACARSLALPCCEEMLVRQRATLSQVGLSPGDRQHNVQGAFACSSSFARGALYGKTLVIIDDVCTSGATLEACAAPLFAAGAREVWGLALARPI
jgi:ComF family protein